jgi:hypothetical protein
MQQITLGQQRSPHQQPSMGQRGPGQQQFSMLPSPGASGSGPQQNQGAPGSQLHGQMQMASPVHVQQQQQQAQQQQPQSQNQNQNLVQHHHKNEENLSEEDILEQIWMMRQEMSCSKGQQTHIFSFP